MAFHDRSYAGGGNLGDGPGAGSIGRQIGLPRPTPMTLTLIGLNSLVALVMIFLGDNRGLVSLLLGLYLLGEDR